MPGQDDRPLRLSNQFSGSFQVGRWGMAGWTVAGQANVFGVNKLGLFHLGVFADVNKNGAGTAAAGNVKRFPHRFGYFVGAAH
jgi:hypothetical protein